VGVLPFADAAARTAAIPTPTDGQFTYLQDTNSTEFYNGSAFEAIGGKILQVVRATDSTERTTTSGTYVDVTGMAVTITPKKSTSAVIVIASFNGRGPAANGEELQTQITDSSNNTLSGAQASINGAGGNTISLNMLTTQIGYSTPATTSATTYKLRFRTSAGTSLIRNNIQTGQMYAIEVSA
jgi:hypothetical protein